MKRTPRLQGLTNLLQMYHTDTVDKTTIVQYVIRSYIQNNYTLLGVFYTLADLSIILKVPDSILQAHINKYYETWEMNNGEEDYRRLARGVAKNALFGALESAHMARKQLLTLDLSQGGQYQPFISKEVNSAIKNQMDAWKTVADLADKLAPKGPSINILNQNNQAAIQHASIGPTEALKIMEAQIADNPILRLGSEGHVSFLLASPNLQNEALPNVVASLEEEAEVAAKVAKKKAMMADFEISQKEAREVHKFHDSVVDEPIE